MAKTIVVSVTQEDIDGGKPESSTSCPIALALRRLDFSYVSVTPFSFELVVE
jgi:hypothetical protein